ncbi:MAG TPA: chromosome segregation protein SMC [Candidatus Latescibacteria bacterium]|nr:chromosome segregation protein SMC [Gemmatimonadaceae bacterium]HJP29969.1 chromosome segregation protein SMC [Candidatus Latescibacterota bacterium]
MRLTHLDIFGFKSFMNKTEIPFGVGITGIVGPNGCGKSNVVEAIRWVLGEQRASAIRGHKMEDVIFAGTRARKPLGMAEVSLTIDNSEHVLPIDYTEVTVTRRLFRSGESDYLLNKVPCRLLDIQNLLMDTGLGPGAYSVMEQGMVDEIISEKTENRRRILEEAAGITKYKARRRSTWNKLESTEADLTRLEDIISEVKRQVDYLGRQVGRARRFQEFKTELDDLELRFGRHQYFGIGAQLQPLQVEFDEVSRASETGLTQFTAREADLEKRRLAVTEAEHALQEAGVALSRCVEEIHELDNRLVSSRERREAREHFIERASGQLEETRRQLQETRRQLGETGENLEAAGAEVESNREKLQSQEATATAADAEYESSRSGLDAENHRLRELLREKGERSGSLARLRSERESLQQDQEQLGAELGTVDKDLASARDSGQQAEQELEQRGERLRRIESDLADGRRRRADAGAAIEASGQKITDLRRGIEAEQARIQVLERVRSGYEGYSSGVRELLVDSPYTELFEGVLGDLIEVDPDWDQAVEVALGDAVEALVARGDSGLLEALTYLRERSGRAGIFPLEWQAPRQAMAIDLSDVAGVQGPLADRVRAGGPVAPLLDRLLHNTYVVDDLTAALEVSRRHRGLSVRLVTADGQGVDIDGRLAGGARSDHDDSVLGRGREIRQLRANVSRQHARLSAAQAADGSEHTRRAVLDGYITDLTELLEVERDAEREVRQRQRSAHEEVNRQQARHTQLQQRLEQSRQRLAELEDGGRGQEERLATIESEAVELEERLQAREERVRSAEQVRREQIEALNALRVESVRVTEKAEGLRREMQRFTGLQQEHGKTIERIEHEVSQAEGDRAGLAEREADTTAQLATKHSERDGLDEQRNERLRHQQEVSVASRELDQEISRLQRQLSTQRERRHQLELKLAELSSEATRIKDRLTEEYDVDVESLGPLNEEGFDAAVAENRLGELRRGIARLGNVHVGVLEEYEEQKERYDFLVQHRDDLMAAVEDLRKTLQHIDRVARRMFRETFEQIREKFRETYGRFFPGGEADLQIEADVDPLESNIEIIARPRGKKLQNIGLLSGGEKALTAIALLFAIYQVKPSPWCILDEVDAPLDDANVERFLRVLREFAKGTQFCMVTHNKLSMASSDTLHGVTMPEEGVSQLVSVHVVEEMLDEAAG